jgi:hypothetical protein
MRFDCGTSNFFSARLLGTRFLLQANGPRKSAYSSRKLISRRNDALTIAF